MLSGRDWQSEEMLKHILKKWGFRQGSREHARTRVQIIRTRSNMDGHEIWHYDIDLNRYYTLKRPKYVHMNIDAMQFIKKLKDCKYVEGKTTDGSLTFLGGAFAKPSKVKRRFLRKQCERMLDLVVEMYQKGLQDVRTPFQEAYVICVTNQQ